MANGKWQIAVFWRGWVEKFEVELPLPKVKARQEGELVLTLAAAGKEVFRSVKQVSVIPDAVASAIKPGQLWNGNQSTSTGPLQTFVIENKNSSHGGHRSPMPCKNVQRNGSPNLKVFAFINKCTGPLFLHGCSHDILGHYLKAIGLLRVLACCTDETHRDPDAEGWWDLEKACFCLRSPKYPTKEKLMESFATFENPQKAGVAAGDGSKH